MPHRAYLPCTVNIYFYMGFKDTKMRNVVLIAVCVCIVNVSTLQINSMINKNIFVSLNDLIKEIYAYINTKIILLYI